MKSIFYFLKNKIIIKKNIIIIIKKGALTEKNYNFNFRSWELKKENLIDFSNSSKVLLQLFIKNNEIIRILPISNKLLNDEWLGDKSKFFYEFNNINKIQHNYINYNFQLKKQFSKISNFFDNKIIIFILKQLIYSFNEKLIKNIYKFNYNFLLTNNNQTTSFIYYKNIFNLQNLKNIYKNNYNFLNNIKKFNNNLYIKTTSIVLCYIIPKFESWVLNIKIIKNNRKLNTIILGINNSIIFNYNYKNIGLTFNLLISFFYNKLLNCRRYSFFYKFIFFGQILNKIKNNEFIFKIINKFKILYKNNKLNYYFFSISSNFNFNDFLKENLYDIKNIKKNKYFKCLINNSYQFLNNPNKNFFFTFINSISNDILPLSIKKHNNIKKNYINLKKYTFIEKNYI